MDITRYTTEDFAADPAFIEWVKKPNPESNKLWEKLMNEHPEKSVMIRDAKDIVLLLRFRQIYLPNADLREVKERIYNTVSLEKEVVADFTFGVSPLDAWMKIAAAIALIIVAGVTFFIFFTQQQVISQSTSNKETKHILLPDGSKMMLNANSEVSFLKDWDNQASREVWLKGEGYFVVQKRNDGSRKVKFLVHAGDVTVEVLGTSFNVKQRFKETVVVLEEGAINLKDNKEENILQLLPGELAEYSLSGKKFLKKKINTSVYTAWKNNRLIFSSTPVKTMVEDIKYVFGVNIVFEDTYILKEEFTGTFPADNLDIIVMSLCKAYNLVPEKSGQQIFFKSR